MRIVNRKEFLSMPSGTVYCKYGDNYFGDMSIKYGSLLNDWDYQAIGDFDDCNDSGEMFDKLDQMKADSSVSFPLNCDTSMRDGLFEDEQMFVVFSSSDVKNIIRILVNTLGYEG